MPPAGRAIRLHPDDNVATALAEIAAGADVAVQHPTAGCMLTADQAIPAGHKLALAPLAPGDAVVKYGEPIGRATAPIAPGEHVHTHNVESARGRGDRPAAEDA